MQPVVGALLLPITFLSAEHKSLITAGDPERNFPAKIPSPMVSSSYVILMIHYSSTEEMLTVL